MIKFLSVLLGLVAEMFNAWRANQWKQQGRQEALKEMNDAIERQIELGEAAIVTPDSERTERLRNRFDRSRAFE